MSVCSKHGFRRRGEGSTSVFKIKACTVKIPNDSWIGTVWSSFGRSIVLKSLRVHLGNYLLLFLNGFHMRPSLDLGISKYVDDVCSEPCGKNYH